MSPRPRSSPARGNPWRAQGGGPLAGHTTYGGIGGETAAGVISRAHDALGALEATLTRDGCEKLAQAFAESSGWPGMTVKRSKDEQAAGRGPVPGAHRSLVSRRRSAASCATRRTSWAPGAPGYDGLDRRGAAGVAAGPDRTRHAVRRSPSRPGAVGAFALPLQLDPHGDDHQRRRRRTPHRKLARTVIGTTQRVGGRDQPGHHGQLVRRGRCRHATPRRPSRRSRSPRTRKLSGSTGSLEILDDTYAG